MSLWSPHFQIDHRHKTDLHIGRKVSIFVKLHPKSANDRDTSDSNDTGSLEACIWKYRANLPVFAEILLSFSPVSKHDTSYSTNTSLNFSQPFWLAIQWLKNDNMTFFDF